MYLKFEKNGYINFDIDDVWPYGSLGLYEFVDLYFCNKLLELYIWVAIQY